MLNVEAKRMRQAIVEQAVICQPGQRVPQSGVGYRGEEALLSVQEQDVAGHGGDEQHHADREDERLTPVRRPKVHGGNGNGQQHGQVRQP
ncbi:hypothetical protein, partial [Mycobacterium sp. E1715]|uniref:hypothetical protein n=1 Tax=Mycobacterium sp. E1715 TaxID=1856863 RepID=UPI0018D46C3D